MRRTRRWVALVLASAFMVTMVSVGAPDKTYASSSSELIEQQKQEQEKLDQMEEEKKNLESALGDMNSDLYNVSNTISQLATDIEKKQAEITQTQSDLETAQAVADQQYEDMKKRIQFMYESSMTNSVGYVLGAANISEFLNRAEYISNITSYDRDMMASYIETKNSIASYMQQLETEQAELEASKSSMETQKTALLTSITDKESQVSSAEGQIASQTDKIADLDEKIRLMKEAEERMQQQMYGGGTNAAMYARSKQIQAETMDTYGRIVTPAPGEEELLAAIIYCEAGCETYAGQLAVGSVVLNRVNCKYFPNTITDVIYAPNQFTPVASGRFALAIEMGMVTDSCRQAAREVLAGGYTGTWLFFHSYWYDNGYVGDVIDHQIFY